MLNFNCDRQAKNDYTASTYNYYRDNYPQFTGISFYEADEEGNLVPFGSSRASEQAHIDIYTLLDSGTKQVWYSTEIKERWGTYFSNTYGKDDDEEGWVYNIEKDGWLEKENSKGRIPLFANLYPDDKITIWNINKVDKTKHIHKPIKQVNIDPDSPRKVQERIQLWNRDGKTIRRIKG